jgi:hypothetical protein
MEGNRARVIKLIVLFLFLLQLKDFMIWSVLCMLGVIATQ